MTIRQSAKNGLAHPRGELHACRALSALGALSTLFVSSRAFAQDEAASDIASSANQAVEDPGGFVTAATEWAMSDGVDIGIKVVSAILVFIVGRIIAGWLAGFLTRTLKKRNFDHALTGFFANMLRWAIILFTVLGILGMFGIETSSFAALIAAMGLAVGLAFQGTLSNFAAGILILVFRPFDIGDRVTLDGETGVVNAIDLFTVTLITPNNVKVTIPNSTACGGKIINLTGQTSRRIDINVGVDYSADIDRTREALTSAIAECEGYESSPAPSVFLNELGDSAVTWQLRLNATDENYWVAYESGIRAVKRALDKAGIGIPYPQMDVHVNNVG